MMVEEQEQEGGSRRDRIEVKKVGESRNGVLCVIMMMLDDALDSDRLFGLALARGVACVGLILGCLAISLPPSSLH